MLRAYVNGEITVCKISILLINSLICNINVDLTCSQSTKRERELEDKIARIGEEYEEVRWFLVSSHSGAFSEGRCRWKAEISRIDEKNLDGQDDFLPLIPLGFVHKKCFNSHSLDGRTDGRTDGWMDG